MEIVVGEDASLNSVTSFQAFVALAFPSLERSDESSSDRRASSPPPWPKIWPASALTANTSTRVKGGCAAVLRLQAGVETVDVDVDVMQQRLAVGAGRLERREPVAQDDLVDLLGRRVGLEAGQQPERVDVRRVDRGQARRVAALGEQQPAVLLRDPAHRPRHVVARDAGDVRDVVLVADDGDAHARRRLRRPRPVGADAEALGLELRLEVGVGDLVEQRRERVVHLRLLVGPGGYGETAVLTGGDDVARSGGEIGGLSRGWEHDDSRRREGDDPGHGGRDY